jgi:tetratricopeptide (TPR) repeat protein
MKTLLYIFLLISTVAFAQKGTLPATNEQDVFKMANKQYADGKYKEAVMGYGIIVAAKQESPELYFNLGNAHYKLNELAPAIYNYEKALILDPDNADVKNNLEFTQQKLVDKITPLPKPGLSGLVENWAGGYHYDSWAWGAVVFAFLTLLTFAGYYLMKKEEHKRLFFAGLCLSVLLFIVSIASAAFLYTAAIDDSPAIVFSKSVAVKNDPDADAADVFTLHEGTKVQVEDQGMDWCKIRLADNREGWIESTALRFCR